MKLEKDYGGNATARRIHAHITVCKEKFGQDGRAWCFVGVLAEVGPMGRIGVAEFGIGGYTPLYLYTETTQLAIQLADAMNTEIGVSEDNAIAIYCDTMKRPAGMRA